MVHIILTVFVTCFMCHFGRTGQYYEMLNMILKNTNKIWISYVNQLLTSGLRRTIIQNHWNCSALSKIQIYTNHINIQIVAFLQKATYFTIAPPPPCFWSDMRDIYYPYTTSIQTLTVGMIAEKGKTGEFYLPIFKQICTGIFWLQHEWRFLLHKQLHLNLTFDQFDIKISYLHSCALGSITVFPFKRSKLSHELQYCGYYPHLPLYFNRNCVSVLLSIQRYVSYNIMFCHMVMDSHSMTSVGLAAPALRSVWCISYTKLKSQLIHFMLQAHKYQLLHLSFISLDNDTKLQVFDGPHSDYRQITCYQASSTQPLKCITSSFLVTVHLIKSIHLPLKPRIKYSMKDMQIIANLSVTSTSSFVMGNFPRLALWKCKSTDISCVWQLHALPGHIVNLTLSFLQNTREDNICQFGCVSVFDQSPNDTIQISPRCFSNQTGQNHSVYSITEHVLLVLHTHKEHCGSFMMHVVVSSSPCTLTRVNLCDHYDALVTIPTKHSKSNNTKCHILQPYHNVSESQFQILIKQASDPRFAPPSPCQTFFSFGQASAFEQNIHFTGFFTSGTQKATDRCH